MKLLLVEKDKEGRRINWRRLPQKGWDMKSLNRETESYKRLDCWGIS